MFTQDEQIPTNYTLSSKPSPRGLTLKAPGDVTFTLSVLGANLFRITFTSPAHPLPPYPSLRRPPFPGQETHTVSISQDGGPSEPLPTEAIFQPISAAKDSATTATLTWTHTPTLTLTLPNTTIPLHADLPHRSYTLDMTGTCHYSCLASSAMHVGLGEKAAPLDLTGRSFVISAADTFCYDSHLTDPLYKHIPFLLTLDKTGCVGILSSSHARSVWNLGSEMDGLWGEYKVHRQSHGGLELYFLAGGTAHEVVQLYADVIGKKPLLVPRWMLGYVGGGMKYSMVDSPPASAAIVAFLDRCKAEEIPISAFQMSSGYTVSETTGTRNVFTWNAHRFPSPEAFLRACHARGVRVLANVKPYVLRAHPAHPGLSAAGAFFADARTGKTAVTRLWSAGGGESGEGSHLDMSSEAGYSWWYHGTKALLEKGVDGIWNDNNEFNLPRDSWLCALDKPVTGGGQARGGDESRGRKNVGLWGRAMHTELTGEASHQACVAVSPRKRPMILTRSATPGTMRHCCSSWGGDNHTSWASMVGGNAISLNASFSLLACYSHDSGGFQGPLPSPTLFLTWLRLSAHTPRLALNCWKTSTRDNLIGDVIEPWMYPDLLSQVRKIFRRRYELVPYTSSLLLRAHRRAVPPVRWTGWGFEHDDVVWHDARLRKGETQFWFGGALLIACAASEEEAVSGKGVEVYLPQTSAGTEYGTDPGSCYCYHYYDTLNATYLRGGSWYRIPVSPPASDTAVATAAAAAAAVAVIARVGTAVPIGKPTPTRATREPDPEFPCDEADDWRGVEIFPPPPRGPPPSLTSTTHHPSPSPASPSSSHAEPPQNLAGEQQQHGQHLKDFADEWLEDDGVSAESENRIAVVQIRYSVRPPPTLRDGREDGTGANKNAQNAQVQDTEVVIAVDVTRRIEGPAGPPDWHPLWKTVDVIMPAGDGRRVVPCLDGGVVVAQEEEGDVKLRMRKDELGRCVWSVPVREVK